jgi:hypothetical protein
MQTSPMLSQGSCRLSYFSTSMLSEHTSHLHGRPIADGRFLTWRNTSNLLQAINFWPGYIFWSIKIKRFAKDASIFHLKLRVAIGLVSFRLSPLQDMPLISTADLSQMVDFWHGEIQPTYYRQSILDMEKFWHLVWANLTSCNFPLFLTTFSKSTVCL